MRAADRSWNDKKKITNLHSPRTDIKMNFAQDNMCGKKNHWKKWTAMYWFSHHAYLGVIPLVNPAMYEAAWKWSEYEVTKWLRNLPTGNSLHVYLHFPIHFLMFHLLFPKFLWAFPMFPLVFLHVSYFRSYDIIIG